MGIYLRGVLFVICICPLRLNLTKSQLLYPLAHKRNLGALKNSPVHGRKKREISDDTENNMENSEPVYQTSPVDYDELLAEIESGVFYPPQSKFVRNEEKRFLGKFVYLMDCATYNLFSRSKAQCTTTTGGSFTKHKAQTYQTPLSPCT